MSFNLNNINEIIEDVKNFHSDLNKTKWILSIIGVFVILIISIITYFTISNISSFSIEVKEARVEFEKGIDTIEEGLKQVVSEIDEGEMNIISLKEDAFKIVDDTEILLDDGIDNKEIESILNRYKFGYESEEDGKLEDSKKNAVTFESLFGFDINPNKIIDEIVTGKFILRLAHIWNQHTYQLDLEYFNQRNVPEVGNIICVPTSAMILLSGLGYDINISEILDFFRYDEELINFVRTNFGSWIEKYIHNEKLYQITGVFVAGMNIYLNRHYPKFQYELEYNYWDIDKIINYIEHYGLMVSTFFPNYVTKGKRTGGHMITITKVYRDFNGIVIAFGINDPYGNPNADYKGYLGWDGEDVIVSYDMMLKVMKSYHDDHQRGSKYLYRVLYFKDKD